ncbi:hypothetical protein WJX77_001970 [Trebouxia sp. C0004]
MVHESLEPARLLLPSWQAPIARAHLSNKACTVAVASGDGSLQVISKADGQHIQIAIKALQGFGVLFAELDVKAAGQRIKLPAVELPQTDQFFDSITSWLSLATKRMSTILLFTCVQDMMQVLEKNRTEPRTAEVDPITEFLHKPTEYSPSLIQSCGLHQTQHASRIWFTETAGLKYLNFPWLASHDISSFVHEQNRSEMRHLRHQNHHLKQQLEQQSDITMKLRDSMEVLTFQMNKRGPVKRASDTNNVEKTTAAARQRRKAEKRSYEQLLAGKQKALMLHDRQRQATHPRPPSSGRGGAVEQSDP